MLGRIICTCIAARLLLRSFLGRSTAALHLDSTCRELLDAVASLFIVARLTITFECCVLEFSVSEFGVAECCVYKFCVSENGLYEFWRTWG